MFFEDIKTVSDSQECTISQCEKEIKSEESFMICNTQEDFRLTTGKLKVTDNQEVCLTDDVAKVLNVTVGDKVRFVAF